MCFAELVLGVQNARHHSVRSARLGSLLHVGDLDLDLPSVEIGYETSISTPPDKIEVSKTAS